MRILVLGHFRAGKDSAAEILQQLYGFTYQSSSMAAARIFLYDALKDKYNYHSFEECFQDRVNHRAEWHDLICEYNKEDKARLAKEILSTSDMYVGMRSNAEVEACQEQGLFDLIIGIYDHRKPLEDKSSFDINIWEKSHVVIPNSGTIQDLTNRLRLLKPLFSKKRVRGCTEPIILPEQSF